MTLKDDLIAALDKAGIEVKPLEIRPSMYASHWFAYSPFGFYQVSARQGAPYWSFDGEDGTEVKAETPSVDEAKDAAQADHLSRILSALQFKDQGSP